MNAIFPNVCSTFPSASAPMKKIPSLHSSLSRCLSLKSPNVIKRHVLAYCVYDVDGSLLLRRKISECSNVSSLPKIGA